MRALPALGGMPTGPAHATGTLLVVPFLRAGAMYRVSFPDGPTPPTTKPLDQSAGAPDADDGGPAAPP